VKHDENVQVIPSFLPFFLLGLVEIVTRNIATYMLIENIRNQELMEAIN
jgi:hypothetical protein